MGLKFPFSEYKRINTNLRSLMDKNLLVEVNIKQIHRIIVSMAKNASSLHGDN